MVDLKFCYVESVTAQLTDGVGWAWEVAQVGSFMYVFQFWWKLFVCAFTNFLLSRTACDLLESHPVSRLRLG